MEQFIYYKNDALSEELCKEIIAYYENNCPDFKTTNKNCMFLSFNSHDNKFNNAKKIRNSLKGHIDNYLNLHGSLMKSDKYEKNIYLRNFVIQKIPKKSTMEESNKNKISTQWCRINKND